MARRLIRAAGQRQTRDALKRAGFHVYSVAARLGVTLMPLHYYSAEPDIHFLARHESLWIEPLPLYGIRVDLDEQIAFLERACLPFREEYAGNAAYRSGVARGYGPGYGYVEAQSLHGILRFLKPRRMVEVGSGVSTYCSLHALALNADESGFRAEMTCVEPFPSVALQEAATDARVELRREPVQATPEALFASLQQNDVLFIDSSHVAKAGSDVVHIILRILPRLAPGVVVHLHDIYFPYAYQRDVLDTFLHNNETPFIAAFLAYNQRYQILASLSHLHYERTKSLRDIFPEYVPQPGRKGLRLGRPPIGGHFPSSLWLRVTS